MGKVYDLVNTAKTRFPKWKLVLSGVLRRRDVSWRRMGALNDKCDRIAKILRTTFIDPNSWIQNLGFSKDGLHLNQNGARALSHQYCRACGLDGGRPDLKQ
jgi:hypothetical protein